VSLQIGFIVGFSEISIVGGTGTTSSNSRNTNVIPLKKQFRADMEPACGSGTLADIPANAIASFTGTSNGDSEGEVDIM